MDEIYKVMINRGGEPYSTTKKVDVISYNNEKIAEVLQAPDLLLTISVKEVKKTGVKELRKIKMDELLEIIKNAGNLFYKDKGDELSCSYKEWVNNVTKATGLPISSVENSGKVIQIMAEKLPHAIDAQTLEGDITSYDTYMLKNGMGYVPKGDVLGLVTPSNYPAVHALWLMGVGVKYPLIHRPSNNEPFTAERLTHALYASGIPEKSVYLLPGSYELATRVLELCDLGMIFGDERSIAQYKNNSKIKVFGPGNSKIFVDDGFENDAQVYKLIRESFMRDGGRGCINVSQIVSTADLSEMMNKLAEDVTSIEYYEPTDRKAEIPAIKENTAQILYRYVGSHIDDNAEDITEMYFKDMLVRNENQTTFLRPTIIKLDYKTLKKSNYKHPLWAELPFQYLVFVDKVPENDFEQTIKNTLTLSIYTDDKFKIEKALKDPTIKKVYVKQPTCNIDPAEPHEGLLTDFLYTKKAVRWI